MAWSDIFLTKDDSMTAAEQAANTRRLQEELARKTAERQRQGTITAEQLDSYQTAITLGNLESQNAAAWEGAKEGAAEGFNNVLNAPGKAVGAVGKGLGQVLGGVLSNIPWWAWLLGLGFAFFYLGGAVLVRGKLAKLAK